MVFPENIVACTLLIQSIYNIYRHPIQSPAKCLDGSPAALYYSIGQNQNAKNILIYFEGGGFCEGTTLTETLQNCYHRSKSNLGSSLGYKQTKNFQNNGILSANQNKNPVFFDWTKIFIPYCDGTLHQGSRLNPITYKDRQLYFRGSNNTIEHLQYLNTALGLFSAQKLVVTGVSAGGTATFIWSNYIYQRSITKNVLSIPDSGIFIAQYINPLSGRQHLIEYSQFLKITNTEITMPLEQCVKDFPDQKYCFSAGNLAKYQKNPFFIIESLYDLYSLIVILDLYCIPTHVKPSKIKNCNYKQILAIQQYRKATIQALKNFTVLQNVGIWAPSCIDHVFISSDTFTSQDYKIPSKTGIKLSEALEKYVKNPNSGQHIYIDQVSWPNNGGCSGIQNQFYF